MANSHHHVPKFGNWDKDNVPYTAYFENARRGGDMINPNDPVENPEAFNNTCSHNHVVDVAAGEVKGSSHASHHSHYTRRHHHVHHRSRESQSQSSSFTTTTAAESGSERSHSDHKRGMSKAGSVTSSSSSSSHHRYRSGSHSFNDPHMNKQGTAIPKFGTWDVSDPKSGEGYTAIFTKIKEEKHIVSGHSPTMSTTPPLNHCSNIKNHCQGHSSTLSKYCCCLFSSKSK